jgi:hypothetical protein
MTYDDDKLPMPKAPTLFPVEPVNTASDRRGTSHYTQVACKFVRDYPIGEILSAELLDTWFGKNDLLTVPPIDTPRSGDAWMAHLQRRHLQVKRVNQSSTHPRMRDYGSTAFVIVAEGGKFHVRAPHEAIVQGRLPRKVLSVCKTGRKKLRYLMESADWSALPAYERALAESIEDDIDLFEKHINSSADALTTKLAKLDRKIRQSMVAGELPKNSDGIGKFLSPPRDEDETE